MNEALSGAFSFAHCSVAMRADGSTCILPNRAGPPPCVAGLNIGLVAMAHAPPHDGEMHPDGDELIVLIDGSISVVLEENPDRIVAVRPGEGVVVPRGIWHRILVHQPCRLLYVTPGPGNQSRTRRRRSSR